MIVGRLYDRIGVNRLAIPGLILCVVTTLPTLVITAHISLLTLTLPLHRTDDWYRHGVCTYNVRVVPGHA